MMRILTAAMVVLAAASAAPAAEEPAAADPWAGSTLAQTTLGEVWLGPPLETGDLRGQVVLLEFWGYRCVPCIASIPHLSKLHATYGAHGLSVVGAHAQGPAKAQAVAIATRSGANYTIVSRASVPGKMTFRGIPKVFVFDHTGAIVFDGHPGDKAMDRAIVAALKRRPHPLLGDVKYTVMKAAAAHVVAGRLGRAWTACEAKRKDTGRAGEESKLLLANLDRYASSLQKRTEKYRTEDPARCLAVLKKLKTEFAGCEISTAADAKLKELAGDKAFQTELKAQQMYAPIAAAFGKVPPRPADPRDRVRWQARWAGGIRQIKARVDQLKEQYPDSRFSAEAEKKLAQLIGG